LQIRLAAGKPRALATGRILIGGGLSDPHGSKSPQEAEFGFSLDRQLLPEVRHI
jgi:hypothetical protein